MKLPQITGVRPFFFLYSRKAIIEYALIIEAGIVMLQDVPKVSLSRTFSFPHRLARGTVELEAS